MPTRFLFVSLAGGAAGLFIIDLNLESGVAISVGYVGLVALSYFAGSVRHTQSIAAGCAMLAILGAAVSPLGGELWKIVSNRLLALAALAITTWFVTRTLRAEARHLAYENELEQLVTERTAELQQSNSALAESNLELRQFAYVASHDLQTPLRSITGFLQLLSARYVDQLDAEARDWIRRTLDSATRLKELIDDLLAYSRIDAQPRTLAPVDLNAVFSAVEGVLSAATDAADAKITRDELPTVTGDRVQLEELLRNLIDNALKYRGEEPLRVHISARERGELWELAVEDNGIGVAAPQRERIFEMFRRLHNEREYPGSGVGLALSRRVVQRHGGTIWVEPGADAGSRFCFTLPRARPI